MKSFFFKLFAVTILVITFLFSCEEIPDETEEPDNSNAYCDSLEAAGIVDDYNTSNFGNNSQIPYDTIIQMCTHGLVESVLNYSHLDHILFFDSYWSWWVPYTQPDSEGFNGYVELATRSDAPEKVLKRYLEFDEYPYADTITEYSIIVHIEARLTFMETFLAQKESIETLSDPEKTEAALKAYEIWLLKNDYDTILYSISPCATCYLLSSLMYYDNYQPMIELADTNAYVESYINRGNVIMCQQTMDAVWPLIEEYLLQLKQDSK